MKMAEKSEKSDFYVCKGLVSPKGQFYCQSVIIFRLTFFFQPKIVNIFLPKMLSKCFESH